MALANYDARAAYATSAVFLREVTMAMYKQASLIFAEDVATPNHEARLALAQKLLLNAQGTAPQWAFAVLTDFGFDDTSTDAGLQAEVAGWVNHFAGV